MREDNVLRVARAHDLKAGYFLNHLTLDDWQPSVTNPRGVMREFGLVLPDDVEVAIGMGGAWVGGRRHGLGSGPVDGLPSPSVSTRLESPS